MKKLIGILILAIATIGFSKGAYAVTAELTSDITATVGTVFSLEFYTEANKVLYSTSVPFSSVDPTSAYNYADTRVEFDGKSDVGLVVKTNQNVAWFLKMSVNAASGLAGKLGAYLGPLYNRNVLPDGAPTNGTRPFGDAWFNIPTESTTIYNAASDEYTNTPFGTLGTLSFKIDGTGLAPGPYAATVTYTLTTTP